MVGPPGLPTPFLPSELQKRLPAAGGEQTSMEPTPMASLRLGLLNSAEPVPLCPVSCWGPWVQVMPCRWASGTGCKLCKARDPRDGCPGLAWCSGTASRTGQCGILKGLCAPYGAGSQLVWSSAWPAGWGRGVPLDSVPAPPPPVSQCCVPRTGVSPPHRRAAGGPSAGRSALLWEPASQAQGWDLHWALQVARRTLPRLTTRGQPRLRPAADSGARRPAAP